MGSLNFRMVTDFSSNMIRVDFQKKVGWIGLTLAEANAFKRLLEMHIDTLQARQHGEDNGKRDQRDS